jgi:hypothetical protein
MPAWPTLISTQYSWRRLGGITVLTGSQVSHPPPAMYPAPGPPPAAGVPSSGTWCGNSAIVIEVSTATNRAAVAVAQLAAR